MACAAAGIVIGVISQTGIGLTFTGIVRAAAQDMLLPALLLTMVAGIILGMGMPTTPAYIVQVALLVPALVRLGVPVEAAHMFVLYFATLSAITPPVAIAVYAACGISRSNIWDTSRDAVKLGLTGFIIPFMFVYGPALLMIGEWHRVALAVMTAVVGVTFLAASITAYFIKPANWLTRLLFFAAAMTSINAGLVTDIVGGLIGATAILSNIKWPAPELPSRQQLPDSIGRVEAPLEPEIGPNEEMQASSRGARPPIRQGSS